MANTSKMKTAPISSAKAPLATTILVVMLLLKESSGLRPDTHWKGRPRSGEASPVARFDDRCGQHDWQTQNPAPNRARTRPKRVIPLTDAGQPPEDRAWEGRGPSRTGGPRTQPGDGPRAADMGPLGLEPSPPD